MDLVTATLKLFSVTTPRRLHYSRKNSGKQRQNSGAPRCSFVRHTGAGPGFPRGTRSRWLIICWKNSKNSKNSENCHSANDIAHRLAPAEEALDVGEVECPIGRAALVGLAACGGGLHLTEEGIHLGRRQPPSGAHAGVAGERATHRLDALLQGQGIAPFGELIGEVAH